MSKAEVEELKKESSEADIVFRKESVAEEELMKESKAVVELMKEPEVEEEEDEVVSPAETKKKQEIILHL